MKVKPFHTSTWLFLCAVSLPLAGCYGAASFLAEAVSGVEDVKVRAAVSPGVTADDLRLLKRVSVVIGTGTAAQTIPFFGVGGDLTSVMADNIALELLNLGFQVIERTSLDKVLQEQGIQLSDIADPTTAAKVGRILGIDAIVLGSVATSQKMEMSTGFMGIGSGITTGQRISDATMRVVGIEQGNVLMMVTLSYKKGQNSTEAAKTMAIALAEKLKNPEGQKAKER